MAASEARPEPNCAAMENNAPAPLRIAVAVPVSPGAMKRATCACMAAPNSAAQCTSQANQKMERTNWLGAVRAAPVTARLRPVPRQDQVSLGSLLQALWMGFDETYNFVIDTVLSIRSMVTGRVSIPENTLGPLRIAYGKPVDIDDLRTADDIRPASQQATERLMARIAELEATL